MRSDAQREASRVNGAKSRGPKTPEGKEKVRLNGLKHGLRAEEVVLPGEDPAAFEAEKRAWIDDWRPRSHTRAVLVERAAIASWRLRRCVRSEAAMRRQAADEAARDFDTDRIARVDRAVGRFDDDPKAALMLLELDATGLDRLLTSWGELADALARGPAGWSQPRYHARLMILLGHHADADPAAVGPAPRASARLLAANTRTGDPLRADEAEEAAEALRRVIAESIRGLRALREQSPDPDDLRRRAVEAASGDTTGEAQLRHRYEMAHDRALRATIKQLLALDRSGADLPEAEPESAPDAPALPQSPPAAPAPPDPVPGPTAPGSLGAGEPGSIPSPDAAPIRRPPPPSRLAPTPAGAGSTP